ncbi:calcium-binding protein [Dongia sedimenti]|uniref:Calcium-binding protein n=1 Tax=Dongia sedimenti TaxID=3064282 RepID=A0ABU0YTH0_9PROT|nr:calcium-binding protein [Rhodospirillaceae bacterium R-7]
MHGFDDKPDKRRDPSRPTPGKPIILDLDGTNGVEITQLSQSNQFYETAGDGYQHRTAWAGAGDAVLGVDADGDGKIDQQNEIVFTEWDPTATDDLQALRNVFDTNKNGWLDNGEDANKNGKLDAGEDLNGNGALDTVGDARYGDFKLLITKADGTVETVSLASLVNAIKLAPDAASYELPDGSSIDGQTVFNKNDGTTGTAAAVTLVNEAQGGAKDADQSSVVTDGLGTIITNLMLDAAGKVASKTTTWTSTDGKTRDITFDTNGDGITDRKQHDVTVAGTSPVATIRTITNKNAADVLLDQTVITTYNDGKAVYDRDMSGGGWYTQREERSADGLTITISDLNPDGTAKGSTTTTFTSDHQTRTVGIDIDGDTLALADNITEYKITAGTGGSRIETWTETNRNTSLKSKTIRETDSQGFVKQLKTDADGDLTFETVVDSAAVVTKDGSGAVTQSVVTQDTHNANATLRSSVRTTLSGDGLHVKTETDADGAGGYELTRTDDTVLNAIETGARLQTLLTKDAGGNLLASTEIWKAADGRRRTVETDLNGDGHNEVEETITIDGVGKTTDTVRNLDSAGNLLSRTVTISSDDGLETTVQTDQAGTGSGFDHSTTSKTTILGSGASEILEVSYDSLGHEITSQKTEISADGLSITLSQNLDNDVAYDRVTKDVTTLDNLATGAATYLTRIVEVKSDGGQLLSSTTTETSKDRRHVKVSADSNGDGAIDAVSTSDLASNGERTSVTTAKTESGAKTSETTTKTSANGLVVTTEENLDGDLDIDRKTVDETKIGIDGHKVQTVTVTNQDASTRAQTITDVSDDGLTTIVQADVDGDTDFDQTSTSVTKLLAAGETQTKVTITNQNGGKRSESVSTTSDDGLKVTTTQDFNGDEVIDATTDDITTVNADGSRTRVVTRTDLHGVLDQVSTTTQFDSRFQDIVRQGTGAVPYYETEKHSVEADGDIVSDLKRYDSAHPGSEAYLLNETKTTTTGNGLKTTAATDIDGNGSFDFSATQQTILEADGGTTVIKSREIASGTLIDKTSVTTSGNGLVTVTRTDSDGLSGDDMTRTDTKVLNANGSETLTSVIVAKDGTELLRQTTTTDADKNHVAATTFIGGRKAQVEDVVVNADGRTVDTTQSYNFLGVKIGTKISGATANGLQKTLEYKDADDKTVDLQTLTTVLNADGSTTDTVVETNGAGIVLVNSSRTVSDDGLKIDADMSVYASVGARLKTSDVTTLNADGSKLRATTGTKADGTLLYSGQQTISDDGLVTTTKLSLDNDANYEVVATSTTATDGAKTAEKTFKGKTGALLRTERQITSADGRDTSILIDRDGDGDIDWAEVQIQNQDGSTTSRVKGNAAFGAPAFSTVTTVKTNAAGGTTTTITDWDSADVIDSITTVVESANKLSTTTTFDTDGDGIVDLTDLTGTSKVEIRDDGTVATRDSVRYANGLLARTTVTEQSSDGRTVNQYIDNDGNGIYEQVITQVTESDGSGSTTSIKNNNNTGRFDSASISTHSANGFVLESKNLAAEAKFKDVTTTFAGSNGSYQWVRNVAGAPIATVTHLIDANGIDTWSWNISDTTAWNKTVSTPYLTASGQITIDVETRDRYIEAANALYKTALDREMGGDEMGMLAQYIVNGQLDRTAIANSIISGGEFLSLHNGSVSWTQNVNFAYLNVFGRLPTAAETASYSSLSSANAIVAIAELGRTSGQSIRSDNRDGIAFGTVSYADATAAVSVNLADQGTYYNIKNVIGSAFADTFYSDAKINGTFIGGKGADVFYGYGTSDTASYQGSDKAVTINLATAYQTAVGGVGDEQNDWFSGVENVTGTDFDDKLTGSTADNVLEGGKGVDTIDGAAGNDTASYAGATKGVTVFLNDDAVNGATQAISGTDADGDVLKNIENLTGSSWNDTLTGNGSANVLNGGLGDDLLQGFGGADKFQGGLGFDTVSYKDSAFGVTADMSRFGLSGLNKTGGVGQFGDAAGDTYEGIENLTGSAFNDVLVGTLENNILDGGAKDLTKPGDDTLIGGAGNDVYMFGAGAGRDEIIDNNRGTFDTSYKDVKRTLSSSYSYSSGHWVAKTHQDVWVTDPYTIAVSMQVDDYDIVLTEKAHGDAGQDTLKLRGNLTIADLAFELRGNDLYVGIKTTSPGVTNASEMKDVVRLVNWTDTADQVEVIQFANGQSVNIADFVTNPGPVQYAGIAGGAGNDTLIGAATAVAEKLIGGVGNDTLSGGAGNDRIEGGAGNDTYMFTRGDGWDSMRDEDLQTVTEIVDSYSYDPNYYYNSYNYTYALPSGGTGSGTANVKFTDTGPRLTTATHTVENNAGKDTIAFGTGITLDDLAMRLQGNDLVIALRNNALPDTDFWALKDQMRVENWVSLNDRIETLAFADGTKLDIGQALSLTSGNKEDDILEGTTGIDVISGDGGNDIITGGEGNDNLSGNTGNDFLSGGEGDDSLNGYAGNDTMTGGVGNDTMSGGDGNDTYYVNDIGDTVVEVANSPYTPPAGFTVMGTAELDGDGQTDVLLWNQTANTAQLQTIKSGVGQTPIALPTWSGWAVAGLADLDGDGDKDVLYTAPGQQYAVYLNGTTQASQAYLSGKAADPIGSITDPDGGTDTVIASIDYTLGTYVENLTLTGTGNLNGTGNTLANVIRGNDGNNAIDGGAGNDILIGGKGDDTYVVDSATDVITEAAGEGTDTVVAKISGLTAMANVEVLRLDDAAGAGAMANANAVGSVLVANTLGSKLTGGGGFDTLISGAGKDTLDGGAGAWDVASYANATGAITVTLDTTLGGANSGEAVGDTYANIEGLGGSAFNDTLYGFKAATALLDGGAGADKLYGGSANDVYRVDNLGDQITDLGGTADMVQSYISYSLTTLGGGFIENLMLLGSDDLNATGDAGTNTITGNGGSNTIDGGNDILGDTLIGGDGNDTYLMRSANEIVTETSTGGTNDTIEIRFAGTAYTVATNIETAKIASGIAAGTITGGATAVILIGNELANTLVGGSANDTLIGGAGADNLNGGSGTVDIAAYDTASAGLTINAANTALSSGDAQGDVYTGIEWVRGSAFNDTITASSTVTTIDGGVGADTLIGTAGNDTFVVDNVGDTISDSAGGAADRVFSYIDWTLQSGIENLWLIGGDLKGTGNAAANQITGTDGNNTLDGGVDAANDTLIGGKGNDNYILRSSGDVVTEAAGEGADTVTVTFSGWTNIANIESVKVDDSLAGATVTAYNYAPSTLIASKLGSTLIGASWDDTLIGGIGNDILQGGGYNDTITGDAGNDVIAGGQGADIMDGGDGIDTLDYSADYYGVTVNLKAGTASGTAADGDKFKNFENLTGTVYDDTLTGDDGDNILDGVGGNDTLIGGKGHDTLKGGSGSNTYVIDDADDTIVELGGGGTDTVKTSLASYELRANIENLTFTGNSDAFGKGNDLANTIYGNEGNNTLDGGDGAGTSFATTNDAIYGGKGNDIYVVRNSGDYIYEAANEGTDTEVFTYSGGTVAANIEFGKLDDSAGANATITASGYSIGIYANSLGSNLVGGAGSEMLFSGAGADTFTGNGGSDVANYATAATAVKATLGGIAGGVQAGEAVGDTYNTMEGLAGSNFDDELWGLGSAASYLIGGKGNDTLHGGTGNDRYDIDSAGDVITDLGGTDVIETWNSLSLAGYAMIENLTANGAAGLTLTGNTLANVITGNAGNDTLDGGVDAAVDTLLGGLGNDTYLIRTLNDVVTEAASSGTDTAIVYASGYKVDSNVEIAKIADGLANMTLWANAAGGTLIGNDTDYNNFFAGAGVDIIDGKGGADYVDYSSSTAAVAINLATGMASGGYAAGDKLISIEHLLGTAYADTLTGDSGANTLYGYSGNDILDGGTGNDIMIGNAGDDTYYVDNVNDIVTEAVGEGTADTVRSTLAAYTLTANVENLTLIGANNGSATGNGLTNTITGDATDNTLDGGLDSVADTLAGGAGNDTYYVRSALDAISEAASAGNDTMIAMVSGITGAANIEYLKLDDAAGAGATITAGANTIKTYANSLGSKLVGSAGSEVLLSGTGADTFTGNGGTDVVSYDTASAAVKATLGGITGGSQAGQATGDIYNTVEGLEGSAFDDELWGLGSAASYLIGGRGNDKLYGGTANDRFDVDSLGDVITDLGGTDLVEASISYSLAGLAGIENLTLNGYGNINGTGSSIVNVIIGNTGDNSLDGGGADGVVDSLTGGDGNDTYVLWNIDTVTETSTGGTNDTVEIRFAGTTYTATNYIETVKIAAGVAAGTIAAASTGSTVYGNELNNSINGNISNDVLIGGAGADALNGGSGQNFASYETAGKQAGGGYDGVIASFANTSLNTGDALGDTYLNLQGLKGSAYNDKLYGFAASSSILDGGQGDDLLTGGTAADTYYIDSLGDTVVEAGAGGVDAVFASASGYTLSANVENLTLIAGALVGTGNDLANSINGTTSNNTLDGGVEGVAANDTLVGKAGDDTYILRNAGDVVTELGGEGNDTVEVRFAGSAYTVANYVETVKIAAGVSAGTITANGQGMTMIGNELANTLVGGALNDIFDGGAGADSFTGNGGSDTVTYANATDYVIADMTKIAGSYGDALNDTFNTVENLVGSAFNDTLTGDAGSNALYGSSGDDNLDGGAGNDVLVGGAGNDLLTGSAGSDIYQIGRGEGYDTIGNAHSDTLADTLQFGASIDESQLWFKRNGNDLEISVIGTADGAKISNWYAGAQNQLAIIKDASGHTLIAANVEALVAAMAAFSVPPVGQTTLDAGQAQVLQPVIAASWS